MSSVTATLFFSCVPNHTLATDTCSCGLVQVFPFSRCVVRSPGTRDPHGKYFLAIGHPSRGCVLQVPLGMGRR